jgi:coenzyme F420-reducing hydrogenase alpha subunit
LTTRKLSKGVTINIDGKDYTLNLDLPAMYDFEQVSGKGILPFLSPIFKVVREAMQAGENMQVGMELVEGLIQSNAITAGDVMHLFWACAGGTDSNMTPREAGRLVRLDNIMEIAAKLFEAAKEALPQADGGDGAEDSDPNPQAA